MTNRGDPELLVLSESEALYQERRKRYLDEEKRRRVRAIEAAAELHARRAWHAVTPIYTNYSKRS